VTAPLQCTTGYTPGTSQTWVLNMSDETAGWTWSETFQYQTGMGSAEWVVEAPMPAVSFPSPITCKPISIRSRPNGTNPNLSLSANGIVMEDPWGQTSKRSNPLEGQWFSTCWGNGTTLMPCTAATVTAASPPPPVPSPAPTPTAALSANPATISFGGQSTLTWSSTNATSCTGGGFAASVPQARHWTYPLGQRVIP
jgi:hypothetical protein